LSGIEDDEEEEEEESTSSESESDEEDDESDRDSEDEREHEFSDDETTGKKKNKKTREVHEKSADPNYDGEDEQEDDDDQGNDDDDDDDDSISQRRKKQKTRHDDDDDKSTTSSSSNKDDTQTTAKTLSDLHQERQERLRTYYASGSFYGSPAAFLSYTIATQLRFGQVSELLWLACVGVTDAHLNARLDLAGYTALSLRLQQTCRALFPTDAVHRAENAVFAEDLIANSGTGASSTTTKTRVSLSEAGRILAETDYRFFLLRHFSLLEAMTYSNYVCTKLKLWTNPGKQMLQELLAKMGLPLKECRQPYAFLKPKLKRTLRERMNEYAEVRYT
jgi:cell division control protein 45